MAVLATQSITLAGLQLAHATASSGGDAFTPDAHTILHVVNTGTGPVTVTIATAVGVLDEAAADVAVTVAAGAEASIGPFPHEFFASPSDGLAHIAYTDAAHTQIAAVGVSHAGVVVVRGTIITASDAQPTDLPSGSIVIAGNGDAFLTLSPTAPTAGQAVTTATSAPLDLPAGSLQVVHALTNEATDLYFVPGVSAADIFLVAAAPLDLGPNQIAVLLGPSGTATDLYVGGS